jgi:hypothetical protein
MTEKCENCTFFDGSKHQKDARTAHAGICSKWTEITFKWENCKGFFSKENLTEKEIFIPLVDVTKLPDVTQLTFF